MEYTMLNGTDYVTIRVASEQAARTMARGREDSGWQVGKDGRGWFVMRPLMDDPTAPNDTGTDR